VGEEPAHRRGGTGCPRGLRRPGPDQRGRNPRAAPAGSRGRPLETPGRDRPGQPL